MRRVVYKCFKFGLAASIWTDPVECIPAAGIFKWIYFHSSNMHLCENLLDKVESSFAGCSSWVVWLTAKERGFILTFISTFKNKKAFFSQSPKNTNCHENNSPLNLLLFPTLKMNVASRVHPPAHTQPVTCVACSPTDNSIFISCGEVRCCLSILSQIVLKKNVQLKHKEERRAIPSNVCLISSLRMAVCSCGTHGNQINQPQE